MDANVFLPATERRQERSHDDLHTAGELAWAAACYAAGENILVAGSETPSSWPFGSGWDKRKKHSRIKQLTIAGALCAAEVDRLHRAEKPQPETAVICVFDGISVVDGVVIIQYRKMAFYGATGVVEIREMPDPMRIDLPSPLWTDS